MASAPGCYGSFKLLPRLDAIVFKYILLPFTFIFFSGPRGESVRYLFTSFKRKNHLFNGSGTYDKKSGERKCNREIVAQEILPTLYVPFSDRWLGGKSCDRTTSFSSIREQQQTHPHVHQQSWWDCKHRDGGMVVVVVEMYKSWTICIVSYRWRGYGRVGHLRHYAIHLEPNLHVVCRAGCQHGQFTSSGGHGRYEAFATQRPHNVAPAFWRGPGKKKRIKTIMRYDLGEFLYTS